MYKGIIISRRSAGSVNFDSFKSMALDPESDPFFITDNEKLWSCYSERVKNI